MTLIEKLMEYQASGEEDTLSQANHALQEYLEHIPKQHLDKFKTSIRWEDDYPKGSYVWGIILK